MSGKVGTQAGREALAQKIMLGAAVFGGLIGFGYITVQKLEIALSRPLLFIGALVVLVGGFAINVLYWRTIDEAAREAQKFAWFWGASAGILVMLPLGALIDSQRLVAVMGQRSPGEWVFFGIAAMLMAQIIGYALVWAGWWLRQR